MDYNSLVEKMAKREQEFEEMYLVDIVDAIESNLLSLEVMYFPVEIKLIFKIKGRLNADLYQFFTKYVVSVLEEKGFNNIEVITEDYKDKVNYIQVNIEIEENRK